ncbi:hypothetical protein CDAR_592831 [Caerostris darwini]|uniref:Uncharacterized protein n=1 Tax=Caerostris darwini TaxID=1538125 RepID=A0AAV4QQ35_9ARAC|nr:hypothetical protein CDAR_592831 [Caerostris darwini]
MTAPLCTHATLYRWQNFLKCVLLAGCHRHSPLQNAIVSNCLLHSLRSEWGKSGRALESLTFESGRRPTPGRSRPPRHPNGIRDVLLEAMLSLEPCCWMWIVQHHANEPTEVIWGTSQADASRVEQLPFHVSKNSSLNLRICGRR